MTEGDIFRNIFLFAIPMVLGNILQQLYTTVDTLVIGNFCDKTALAAMGTSSQPVEVLLCVFLGIGSGVSILVSQYVGGGHQERLRAICQTSISFIYMCGIPMAIIGFIVSPFIMDFMGVPEDTMDQAISYTRIMFFGALGNHGYNMNAGILRGMGDSKASLWFLMVSCFTNICLDLLFVPVFGLGVMGAAISTILSMYLSWIVSVLYIRKKFPEIAFTILPKKISGEELKSILLIGLPIGINNSLFAFGHMVIQTLVNENGSDFMAGASVAGRVTSLANIAINGFSSAASTFSGQNYGAGKYDRLRRGYIRIPLVSGGITLLFGIIFVLIRMPILRFFSQDDMVLLYASRFVVITLAGQWCYAVYNTISNIVNGVGLIKYSTLISFLMLWAVRIPVAYLISDHFDSTYLMISFPVSFVFGMLGMILYYIFSSKWKKIIRDGEKTIYQGEN
ncbi:MAG: MATE family efflux transporter [Eubacterium sp.]|nr:MATE family efflux transporter [Eubacterium sp.]